MSYPFAGQYGAAQVVNPSGVPLTSTSVNVYLHGGVTPAALYTDHTKATGATNPTTTDATGNLTFWADPGTYDLAIAGQANVPVVVTVIDPGDIPAVVAADATITVDGTTVAPTIARAAITGDVAISAGSNAATVNAIGGVVVSGTAAAGLGIVATGASAANWAYPPAAAYFAGVLGTNVALTSTTALVLTTPSLAIGTWLLEFKVGILCAGSSGVFGIQASAGTAVATFAGSVEANSQIVSSNWGTLSVKCVAVVTTAGTITCYGKGGSSGTAEVNGTTYSSTITGYTALRIA